MTMDIYISGPGFGESIILIWEEAGIKKAAIIDCYAPGPHGTLFIKWIKEELNIDHLAFIVATHPHTDHITNMHKLMQAYHGKMDWFWWWGGLSESQYIFYFKKLARTLKSEIEDLNLRANTVAEILLERKRQFDQCQKPLKDEASQICRIYSDQSGMLNVKSISPWPDQLTRFTEKVMDGVTAGNVVSDTFSEINRSCIALVIEYGRSQIVLCSDMEKGNWDELRNSKMCPSFMPCVVKVSHHGSRTGKVPGMWSTDGFFVNKKYPTIAVVTPWRGRLPEQKVINEICRAGCKVYITGQPCLGRHGNIRPWNSYIHLQVDRHGKAAVIDHSLNVVAF